MLGKLSVIHQVLAIFGQLQQRELLGFLGWLLRLWARALLSHRQWLGHSPLACSVSQHRAFNQQAILLLEMCPMRMNYVQR